MHSIDINRSNASLARHHTFAVIRCEPEPIYGEKENARIQQGRNTPSAFSTHHFCGLRGDRDRFFCHQPCCQVAAQELKPR